MEKKKCKPSLRKYNKCFAAALSPDVWFKNLRGQEGVYLLELLVAVFVSSLFAATLMGNFADTSRLATAGQNQILAADIAQSIIDNARNTSYKTLYDNKGTYTILVNRTSSGQGGPAILSRPVLLDMINNVYAIATEHNLFNANVTETIGDGSYPNTLVVTVNISWREGTANKNYQGQSGLSTLISANGIHN